ncbi:MAG: hypothetical protein D6808_02485 [Candidatus Dadabacteria bacterium]|nr:MAG: hypothetical protein D6808_02485 [Candidatus Dadabacteria bacterium]
MDFLPITKEVSEEGKMAELNQSIHEANPCGFPPDMNLPSEFRKLDTALYSPSWSIELVTTEEDLKRAANSLRGREVISLDTETYDYRIGKEKLGLVQIGDPDSQTVFIIDPLAVGSLEPLRDVLESVNTKVVAHNIAFEERQFRREGIRIENGVDTLEMARRLRPDMPRHTLKACCKHILGIEISKEEQESEWGERPLRERQLVYAALDAELCYILYEKLREIEEESLVDLSGMNVEDLMALLNETVKERLQLTRDIADRVAALQERERRVVEEIKKALLEGGAEEYRGELGYAGVKEVQKTAVDADLLRREFPEIAEEAIEEKVEKKRLLALFKKYGIPPTLIKKVLRDKGSYKRVTVLPDP